MLYGAFEKILSDNLTAFVGDENVTVRVRDLMMGQPHIEIIRDGIVTTAEIVSCAFINKARYLDREDYVRYIRVDADGEKYKTCEEDCKYLEEIVKYLSKIYVEKDLKIITKEE